MSAAAATAVGDTCCTSGSGDLDEPLLRSRGCSGPGGLGRGSDGPRYHGYRPPGGYRLGGFPLRAATAARLAAMDDATDSRVVMALGDSSSLPLLTLPSLSGLWNTRRSSLDIIVFRVRMPIVFFFRLKTY